MPVTHHSPGPTKPANASREFRPVASPSASLTLALATLLGTTPTLIPLVAQAPDQQPIRIASPGSSLQPIDSDRMWAPEAAETPRIWRQLELPPLPEDSLDLSKGDQLSLSHVNDASVLRLARTLSLQHRRYLLYLYARLNRPQIAETLATDILTTNPTDKNALLVLASMYVERQEIEKSLVIAKRLVAAYPADDQALYFLGAAYYLSGQYQNANQIFRDLKLEQFPKERFPYTTDLASSALQAGDWYRGMLAYQELLRHHDLSEELRAEVRTVLDGIYRRHLPRLTSTVTSSILDSGSRLKSEAEYSQPITDGGRVSLRVEHNDLGIDSSREFREQSSDRIEGMLKWTQTHSLRWEHSIGLGASQDEPIFTFDSKRTFGTERWLQLGVTANQRSSDSLLMEHLNGRQHRITLTGTYLHEHDVILSANAHTRRVTLQDQIIGNGHGINLNVEKILFRQSPDIRIGYRGQVLKFSRSGESIALPANVFQGATTPATRQFVSQNLILPRINRHGVYIRFTDDLSEAWQYRAGAGWDYLFAQASTGYDGFLGLSFWPRKSLELAIDGRYSTAANTSDNASGLLEAVFSFRYYF